MMKKLRFMCLLIVVSMFLCNFSFLTADATETDALYGKVAGIGWDAFGEVTVWIENADGNMTSYYFDNGISINGGYYRDFDEYFDNEDISVGVFAQFELKDGKIKVLNFSESSEEFADLSYDAETQTFVGLEDFADLPVFYEYGTPYLDGEHLYTVEVYDYAINIIDMKAVNYPETIKLIDIDSGINLNRAQNIDIWCKTTADMEDYILKCKLYYQDEELTIDYISDMNELVVKNLPDLSRTYTIEVWLEDNAGEQASPVYTKMFDTEKATKFYGKIVDFNATEDMLSDIVVNLLIVHTDGSEKVYSCADGIFVNEDKYRDLWELYDALYNILDTEVFAEVVLDGEKIVMINFGKESELVEDVAYDTDAEAFVGLEDFADLPVYYEYGTPYLDGEHLYTVEVYDYAINVIDMKAVDYPSTINHIDISSGLSADCLQYIVADCKTDDDIEGFILKGELYNQNNELVDECAYEWGSAEFNGLPNASGLYTIKVWLEDENGNNVSPVYTKEYNTDEVPVYSGRVLAGDLSIGTWDEGYLTLLIDVDGEEWVCYCEERLNIDGRLYRDMEEALNAIPIGARIEFAFKGDYISVLRVEPLLEFKVEGKLEDGEFKIYLDNNTEEKKKGKVYCAVYDKRNMLKRFYIRDLELDKFSDTYEYITAEDISAGDYVKVFVWDDNLSPLTSAPLVLTNIAQ